MLLLYRSGPERSLHSPKSVEKIYVGFAFPNNIACRCVQFSTTIFTTDKKSLSPALASSTRQVAGTERLRYDALETSSYLQRSVERRHAPGDAPVLRNRLPPHRNI